MGYTWQDKAKMFVCKIFNHFPRDKWEYNGTHANCGCCGKVVSKTGSKWA